MRTVWAVKKSFRRAALLHRLAVFPQDVLYIGRSRGRLGRVGRLWRLRRAGVRETAGRRGLRSDPSSCVAGWHPVCSLMCGRDELLARPTPVEAVTVQCSPRDPPEPFLHRRNVSATDGIPRPSILVPPLSTLKPYLELIMEQYRPGGWLSYQ